MTTEEAHDQAIRWGKKVTAMIYNAIVSGQPTKITLNIKEGDDLKIEEVRSSIIAQ